MSRGILTALQEFIAFMDAQGCAPANSSDILDTGGKWKDYQIKDDPATKKKGYYILRIEGDFISGACGDRREGITYQFYRTPRSTRSEEEKRLWEAKREAAARKLEEDKEKAYKDKAALAKKRWEAASACDFHPYLEVKGVQPHGLKIDAAGRLIVPLYADGRLWNLQTIDADGSKLFMGQAKKKGCYYPLANKDDDKALIYICEGFATAAAVRESTGAISIVAFDAGNLLPVAQTMRDKYPDSRLVIAADNDASGVGEKKAIEAAEAVNGEVALCPEFGKDWNDFYQLNGHEATKLQIEGIKTPAPVAPVIDVEVSEKPVAKKQKAKQKPPLVALPSVVDMEKSDEGNGVLDGWQNELLLGPNNKLVKNSLNNLLVVLSKHDDLRGVFKMNEFDSQIYVTRCPPWVNMDEFTVHALSDIDIFKCAAWFEVKGLTGDVGKVYQAIQMVAYDYRFHPAREYFNSLTWDGVSRLGSWLHAYMGASKDDDADYISFIGKKWLVAAVKRVYEPGCKFDHVLVAEGKQGIGKSTAFETLATFGTDKEEKYFLDNVKIGDLQNKDTIMSLQGALIVEMAELAGFNKKEDEEIKSWVTIKEDKCRTPYSKTHTVFKRQFVLCGTTNNYEYLKDPTGNRRWWPFVCEGVNIAGLKGIKEQLWAEAVTLYKAGYYIGPTPHEMQLAEIAQSKRLTTDPWESAVRTAVKNLYKPDGFTIGDVMEQMGLALRERGMGEKRRIGNVLKQIGYNNDKILRTNVGSQRLWQPTRNDYEVQYDDD